MILPPAAACMSDEYSGAKATVEAVEIIRKEALRLLLCAEAQQIGQRTGFSIADAGESCAASGKLLQCAGTVCEQLEQRQDTFPNQLTDLLPGGIQLW